MRSSSSMYKILKTAMTSWYDVRLLQGVNIYGLDVLRSIDISSSLTSGSGIDVGNANSSECRITILEESANWERMAKFTVQFRICNTENNAASDWITFGSFYTDQRSEDKNGNLSIVAYDKMLMTEQSWTDKIPEELLPASYPITARAWATMIQSAGLATFADLTQLDDNVAFVGLDTSTTIRDVLKSIAAVHAGNWTITPDETLTLVQFVNLDIQTATADQYLDLALSMQEFSDSPMLDPITGVHLETDSGTVMEAGDDTGYVLKANCSVSSTEGVAALCLDRIENYVYKPFSSYVSYLDPVAELGDSIAIDGEMYQLMSANWNFSKLPSADLTAPYDQEIDHEYTIPSEQAKNYRKAMAAVDQRMGDYVRFDEFSTAIEQNETAITLVASHTFVDQTTYNEQIAQIQNQLDGNIQSWSGNIVPTLNNSPAVDWDTAAKRAEHVGDMYFINSDAGIPEAGQYYRFEDNNGVYSWQLITDSAVTEALARAAAAMAAAEDAQGTASESLTEAQLKGRIFVVQPTPPYSVGDLWFNDAQSEILTCMTPRASGGFSASDWVKRNKYTDDSAFAAFQDAYNATISAIQDQIDQKAETYYQDYDPMVDWDATIAGIAIAGINVVGFDGEIGMTHKGDLWYKTTDNTTWFWDGAQWIRQDVPDDVFDKIDGKAQVFISEPHVPYNVGDLWFDSSTSAILTCIHASPTGEFAASDWEERNKYTDDTAANSVAQQLNTFVSAVYTPEIAAIQADLDGKVDTWFYADEPTLLNLPASEWTNDAERNNHLDDLYYDTRYGHTYRFMYTVARGYYWSQIQDTGISIAMITASHAQDTADGKRRVFIKQPKNTDVYDIGDLWVNATYENLYSNDLLRARVGKSAGVSFSIDHWEKASKYTDDSALTNFVNMVYDPDIAAIQTELDGKIDTYFYAYEPTLLNVPASAWNTDALRAEHVGDLFFSTISGYTYRFAGSGSSFSWERIKDSDITAAMTTASQAQDTADGKRRVFVTQPVKADAYDVGDLWVNATYGTTYSNDLLRCKTSKASGTNFNISHWEKASKYTDDTAAEAVAQALTTFESTFSVEPSQISAEIAKSVVKDHQSTKTTFGWLLSDTSHTWYANNQEVAKIQQSGLSVTGSITATSGYIGNGSSGFAIDSTNIHNGMTSLSDTTHNGVYVGTNGIALGKGKFKVTSSGSVTASDMTITGGSISIKDGSNNVIFSASSSGVYVNGNGTFTGTVYAGNIVSGADQQGAGYFDGSGIVTGSIEGGYGGQIAQYTLEDYNVAQTGGYGAFTTASFSSGVQTSLYQADMFGLATQANPSDFPARFKAGYITAANTMTARDFTVSPESGTEITLSNHYHSVTVNDQTGVVTFGRPYNTNTPPSFNIADTQKYRDDVLAATVASLDIEYDYDSSMHIYQMWGIAKNASQTTVYRTPVNMPWNTDRSAYVDGKTDGAAEVTVNAVTQYSYSSTGDKSVSIENGYLRYNNGQLIGRVSISLNGNSNTSTCVVSMDGQRAVDAARPRSIVRRTNLATGTEMPDTWSDSTNTGYVYLRATTNDSNIYVDGNIEVNTSSAIYQAGYTAGAGSASVTITASGLPTTTDSDWRTYDQSIGFGANSIYAMSGTQFCRIQINAGGVQRVVRIGVDSVSGITVTRTYGDNRDWQFEDDGVQVGVTLEAVNGNTVVRTGTGAVDVSDIVNFWAESAYDHASALDTDSGNYGDYNVSLNLGLTGKSYVSGSQRYGRIGIYNGNNILLKTVRVYMPTSSGGSVSVNRGEYPAGTYYNENGYTIKYYKYNSSYQGFVKALATSGGSTVGEGDIDVTDLVTAFYNMGRAAGGGGGASTPIQLRCTGKSSSGGIAQTWTFQITSTTDYPFVVGTSYNFYY